MCVCLYITLSAHGKNMEGHMLGCYQEVPVWRKRPWCGWSHEGEKEQDHKTKQKTQHAWDDTHVHLIINMYLHVRNFKNKILKEREKEKNKPVGGAAKGCAGLTRWARPSRRWSGLLFSGSHFTSSITAGFGHHTRLPPTWQAWLHWNHSYCGVRLKTAYVLGYTRRE